MKTREDMHTYQSKAVEFVRNKKRVGLFLGMGLGKTVSILTVVADLVDGLAVQRVLVVAPLRVANTVWKQEAAKWAHTKHLGVSVCTGTERARRTALMVTADVYVINRENIPWLVELYGKKWPFDMVVIDESSSFKSPSSVRFRRMKQVRRLSEYMVLLSGTPAPNGLLDLWPQMFLLDSGEALGQTMTGYKQRWFDSDYMGYRLAPKKGAVEEIHRLIQPFVLSMSAEDYLDVPERIDLVEMVALPPKVRREYDLFEFNLLAELDNGEEIEAVNAAVLAGKLLQWANGAVYTDTKKNWYELHKVKLDALAEVIEDNPSENIMVAYNFKSDLARLRARFPEAVMLDNNPETVEKWNRGEIKLMLAHPASCGHGLNLHEGGSVIVWFGLNWSLELDQQMNGRLHRQGQTRPVRVVRIVCEDTIDERVMMVIADKDATQSALLKALRRDSDNLKETTMDKPREFKLILMDDLWKYEAEGWNIDRDKPMPHVSLGGWHSVYVWREILK